MPRKVRSNASSLSRIYDDEDVEHRRCRQRNAENQIASHARSPSALQRMRCVFSDGRYESRLTGSLMSSVKNAARGEATGCRNEEIGERALRRGTIAFEHTANHHARKDRRDDSPERAPEEELCTTRALERLLQ